MNQAMAHPNKAAPIDLGQARLYFTRNMIGRSAHNLYRTAARQEQNLIDGNFIVAATRQNSQRRRCETPHVDQPSPGG